MAMFWSKKPKATKDYSQTGAPKVAQTKKVGVKGQKKSKSEKSESKVVVAKANPGVVSAQAVGSAAHAIIRPRITEKSGLLSQGGVYTFEISISANKHTVARAITTLYKVTPVKVSIINRKAKQVFIRGKKGRVPAVRKAMVTVKKGDKIDFV